MNSEMFDKIVKARAQERVDKKIVAFKKACLEASEQLLYGRSSDYVHDTSNALAQSGRRAVFAILAGENNRNGWPEALWQSEREKVRDEILGTLDEMQKALLAAEKAEPGENSPAGVEPKATMDDDF